MSLGSPTEALSALNFVPDPGTGMVDRELGIVGADPAFVSAVLQARTFAASGLPLLIVGETGTGKELVAQLAHRACGRRGRMVELDCGTLPEDLADSLLFGHRKGAFTGAHAQTDGLIAEADGGTLFLDELASLSEPLQRKLLRVLETGQVRRLGSGRPRDLDFQLVAAVQPDIADRVRGGDFRSDLLHRVAGAVIRLPSLIQRGTDVLLLARHFAQRHGRTLSIRAESFLRERTWPGNVRELKWLVERASVFAEHEINLAAIETAAASGAAQLVALVEEDDELSFQELRAACLTHRGSPDPIASSLGISRSTLYRRMQNAGLSLRDFKRGGEARVN